MPLSDLFPEPQWPSCGHGSTPEDPVGCRGLPVDPYQACLGHLADADRAAYLAALNPGDDIDHRGTTLNQRLLGELLDALRDPVTDHPRVRSAWFREAVFDCDARFGSATFADVTSFDGATFTGAASFQGATFDRIVSFTDATFTGMVWSERAAFAGIASFSGATFERDAWFGGAVFSGMAAFDGATFTGAAAFDDVTFSDAATFEHATFTGAASYVQATFDRNAWFDEATFTEGARFDEATFTGDARFGKATFTGEARFGKAAFNRSAWFGRTIFTGNAWFREATFDRAREIGPLACAGQLVLSGASFGTAVTISAAARRVLCQRTRWASTATVRLRYAAADFDHAVFEYPLTLAAEPEPFTSSDGTTVSEAVMPGAPGAGVRVVSLRGVDAAHLVLADVDLSRCLLAGTVHLDQIRLEGACTFAATPGGLHCQGRQAATAGTATPAVAPAGWRWPSRLPMRFTARRVLAEEHIWRARQGRAVRGWDRAVLGPQHAGPAQLAPVYRSLRKALEDGKDEPGAADFYYAEMEMRRLDPATPSAERKLLAGYWALSGYGLRAGRALGWLLGAMVATLLAMTLWGIPRHTPEQVATGRQAAPGQTVRYTVETTDPVNPSGPPHERLTGPRFEKSLRVVVNSVVFRSSGQDLTTAGSYLEMASRLTEPVLLALAVFAVRGRIKR